MALCKGGKLRSLGNAKGEHIGYGFNCPGCKAFHAVYTNREYSPKACWTFNGDTELPTFQPSLLVYEHGERGGAYYQPRCHSFIVGGRMQFLNDCTHALAGKTVDLPVWDDRPFQDNHAA